MPSVWTDSSNCSRPRPCLSEPTFHSTLHFLSTYRKIDLPVGHRECWGFHAGDTIHKTGLTPTSLCVEALPWACHTQPNRVWHGSCAYTPAKSGKGHSTCFVASADKAKADLLSNGNKWLVKCVTPASRLLPWRLFSPKNILVGQHLASPVPALTPSLAGEYEC